VVCRVFVFLFFVAPSLAVFKYASGFNQDVSKWNTGAVTDMHSSKWTLSPSLCYIYYNTTTRVSCSHTFCFAPSLAVFFGASSFNQDVSKWNTGAVTDMHSSKWTLSPSLYGHAFRSFIVLFTCHSL
jgi:surface protein